MDFELASSRDIAPFVCRYARKITYINSYLRKIMNDTVICGASYDIRTSPSKKKMKLLMLLSELTCPNP